jgi:hypothetical protein
MHITFLIQMSLVLIFFFQTFPTIIHADEPEPIAIIKHKDIVDRPKQIEIGIYVINIEKVNSAEQSYKATVALDMKWNDPTLICTLPVDKDKIRKFDLEEIWNPSVVIINKQSAVKQFEEKARVDCLGNVEYGQILYGDFLTTANIKNFPFDQRFLEIELISTEYETNELRFVKNEKATGRDEQFSITDWNIGEIPIAESAVYRFKPGNLELASFIYKLKAKRNHNFFLWKIIVPLIMIVFMSWAVFWISPSQLGPQIGLSVTSMLTLIAYRFAIGNIVPNVDYLTRFDKFVFGSTLLVFLALIETVISGSVSFSKNEELANSIDRYSRFIFPGVFIVILVYSFFI